MNSPPMSHLFSIGTSLSTREPFRQRRLGIRANLPHAKTSRNRGSRGPRGAILAKQSTVGPAALARNSSAATTPCRPDFSWSSASFPDDQRLSPTPFSLLLDQLTRAGPHPSLRAPGWPRHGTSPGVVRHGSRWLCDALSSSPGRGSDSTTPSIIPTLQHLVLPLLPRSWPSTGLDLSTYLSVQNYKNTASP